MFEVYLNDRPTGLTYSGRYGRRLAAQVARDLRYIGGRSSYSVRRVR